MAAKESVSITYYVGAVNICLAAIWGALYGLGFLTTKSITSANATPFYVGTLFAAGFGLVFPFFEKTMAGKTKINQGLMMSIVAILAYAGYIAVYFLRGTLEFYSFGINIG